VQNHVLALPDPNVLVVKKCYPLPVEVIVRGYLTGVTETSLWTHYQKGQRDFGDFSLPDSLKKNAPLATPVLTPTTKSETHDRPLTTQEIIQAGILSKAQWDEIADKAIQLFQRGQTIAQQSALILVDTKYEFGIDENEEIVLIDEIHTPDSSRYWQANHYTEKLAAGEEPDYFDKEFLRLWFKQNCDPYQDAVLPTAPDAMITELSNRYIKIFEQLTKQPFHRQADLNVIERIAKNLQPYQVNPSS
jgi:phosphoribosylaminoimidazole-succinocarboxamide synthase